MAATVERVSWGVRNLSMAIPGPETGGILLVEGGKRAGLALCREMLCEEIYAGRPVHWIDGGMSLDPSALIRPLSDRGRTSSSLSLLRTCRAFTAHQMHELVSRLERDLLVFEDGGDVRLVVLSDLASMFADSQVKKAEGIAMLESCLRVSKEVAEEKGLLVVITVVRSRSPPLPKTMISAMRGQADDRIALISYRGGQMTARLDSLGVTVRPLSNRAPYPRLSDFTGEAQSSREVCTEPPLESLSSDSPNGDSKDEAARSASAS